MSTQVTKTNAVRLLEAANLLLDALEYPIEDGLIDAVSMAKKLNKSPEEVFKTLVTVGKPKCYYVFIIPGSYELDLKLAAKAAGEKSIEMIPQKELLPLTGYIHGGCSPVGMKKLFPTFLDETSLLYDKIYVSGGKVGLSVGVNPEQLMEFLNGTIVEVAREKK
jgi:Cys-tRNA(Pro)/Cys-tRNA(Cys) deacylase